MRELVILIDDAPTGVFGPTDTLLASCLKSLEAVALGLLELVRSGPSVLRDRELEWTKNKRSETPIYRDSPTPP